MRSVVVASVAGVLCVVSLAHACTPDLPAAGQKPQLIESKHYALAFRTQPEKIVVGAHFVVEFALCAKDGAVMPENVRVDAHMPEHHHGMNYKTSVTGSGAGNYRAQGLLFHMPGRWEYIFEVRAGGAAERMTTSVVLR